MKRHRIYVGHVGGKAAPGRTYTSWDIENSARDRFLGCAIFAGFGCWQGRSEPTTVVEVVTFKPEEDRHVREQAEELRREFGQDAVLYTVEPVSAEFIGLP